MRVLLLVLAALQAVVAVRVFARLARTKSGSRVARVEPRTTTTEKISVIVPVLNEEARLAQCLRGLTAQGPEVAEILVVDGGSTDRTIGLVERFAQNDKRIRLVRAAPLPKRGNGKALGLQAAWEVSSKDSEWLLTIDADVRPDPALGRTLLEHARHEGVPALSIATLQRISGPAEGLVHPAMLATLVYRFGIPGTATNRPERVQANGQCFLVRRAILAEVGGFGGVVDSVCEDITLARAIAAAGHRVGFYETEGLASVEMYSGWREAWANWPRSLHLRDRFASRFGSVGLLEVTLVQALPLWLAPVCARWLGRHPATLVNVALVTARMGVLVGTARAYDRNPWTYWLSPLLDLPVAARLWMSWRQERHEWRGREIIIGRCG